ncbi:MAG: energy transducer TonB, partial [Pseudomonadota bacterium]
MSYVYHHSPVLPWTITEEEEQRFRRTVKRSLLIVLLLSLIMAFLPVPKLDRAKVEEVPPRLAKLLLERQPPPPPPVVQQPEAPKAEAPKKKEDPKPKVEEKPKKNIETARAKAERSGLLAFKDDLADLRTNPVTTSVTKSKPLTSGVGAGPSKPMERAIITS